jgi:hypothetical protein
MAGAFGAPDSKMVARAGQLTLGHPGSRHSGRHGTAGTEYTVPSPNRPTRNARPMACTQTGSILGRVPAGSGATTPPGGGAASSSA